MSRAQPKMLVRVLPTGVLCMFRRPHPSFSDVFRRFPALSGAFRRFPALSGIFRHAAKSTDRQTRLVLFELASRGDHLSAPYIGPRDSVGRIPCSSKSSKSTPQASQQAFSTSESAPAYFFERDCFVDSFWGALGSDFRPYPSQSAPKSGHRAPQKLSTKQSRSTKIRRSRL